MISKHGNSSKPISVYAQRDVEHPIKSSSAGLNINISSFTLNIGLALDNIGISGSVRNGSTTNGFGIRANISELKIGFDVETCNEIDNSTSEISYGNASVSGLAIAFAYVYLKTGQRMPMPAEEY